MRANPEPGTVFAGRYKLLSPLARGGMGSVWKAEHLALASEVAVKLIDPRVAELEMGVPRFLREARALASLHSPHIVRVIDFGSEGEIIYLVMELLEGRTLGQRIAADGKLSLSETLRVVGEVGKAMSHAHARGIVHRDLKPDNVFLCDQSRDHMTKVLDFGIAKPLGLVGNAATTDAGTFLGTPSYMSPEQCRGVKSIDQRSDLWAMGAITYECLVGKRLFGGEVIGDLVVRICTEDPPPISHDGRVPERFDAWLRKAMARDPEGRFQSASELVRALAWALELEPSASPNPALADTQLELPVDSRPTEHAAGLGTLDRGTASQVPAGEPSRTRKALPRLLLAGASVAALGGLLSLLLRPSAAPLAAPVDVRALAPSDPLTLPSPPTTALAAPASGSSSVRETDGRDAGVSVAPPARVPVQPGKSPASAAPPRSFVPRRQRIQTPDDDEALRSKR